MFCEFVCVSLIDFPHILNPFLTRGDLYMRGSVWFNGRIIFLFSIDSSLRFPLINRVGDSLVCLSVTNSDLFR